ncbi:hypothetical protein BST63_05335 [Bradyrhizobium canariense]|uniref:Uncharacterized protein n=1 Tax=Bradyrhizobium canariense TaxID=255045 RepID=A0ABX3X9W5_9BRAD|nr:hypothetical protein BST63_05335 [Bradyrhizobium canariense]
MPDLARGDGMAFFGCRALEFLSIVRAMPFAAGLGARLRLLGRFLAGSGRKGGGGIDFLANCSNYHPIRYLTDVHSSVFRLAWCLLKSTRSARSVIESE